MKPLAQNTLIQSRYLIVQLIGKGGMGEVYLAVDQRLGSAVALKRTFFADDEMLGNAFEREARILARLRHPVLPKVSDHFGEGEEQFLVMEHISGDDLAKRLELAQKPFPVQWVMFWADQLLDALAYLHSHEPPIIHRDIKPQNLKLTDDNNVVLLDFGLSKNSTGNTKITPGSSGSTGSVVGYTPHYAPMEQIRGVGTSAQSDIYSLSATLYQLLTNVVPADALSRADALLNGSPDPVSPPSDLVTEISSAVSTVILRGMEVSLEKRFTNAREMQKALRKAYSNAKDEMSAKTVAFAAGDSTSNSSAPVHNTSFDKTEVMDYSPGQTPSVPSPVVEAVGADAAAAGADMEATIAFDPGAHPNLPKQADVKTAIFNADDYTQAPSEAIEEPSEVSWADDAAEIQPDANGNASENEWAVEPDLPETPSPDATMPIIAFEQTAGAAQPDPYATRIGEAEQEAAVTSPVAAAALTPKKSSRKAIFVVAGLFALLFIGSAAIGAGWFIYSNMNSAAAEVEPSPSPEESVLPTPSPEVTPETAFESNTSDNSEIGPEDANTSANNAPFVEPTPEAGPERTRQQVVTRTSPGKSNSTPATKTATPTPKPKRDDKTVILQ